MSSEAAVILLVALLAAGTLLAGRAGIRSIQRARTVIFYRTRRSHMLAGWQWLVLAGVLLSSTVASALFGEPYADQLLSPALQAGLFPSSVPTAESTREVTEVPVAAVPSRSPTARPTRTQPPSPIPASLASSTLAPSATPGQTQTARPAATRDLSALATRAARTLQARLDVLALSRTPTQTPTATPTASQTATITPTATGTASPTSTLTPRASRTSPPTSTFTQTPSPEAPASLTPTFTPSRTSTATATQTPRPTLTLTATRTMRPTSTFTSTPSPVPSPTRTPMYAEVSVYFTDNDRLIAGQLPYEVPVRRLVPTSRDAVTAVLDEFFRGPSDVERNQGLAVVHNGFTGYSRVEIANGVAHLHLTGTCQSNGTLYNIGRALMASLKQFPEVQFVKIYDQGGSTREPAARLDSIPACLDPFFTPSITPLPTSTLALRSTPTRTPRPTLVPFSPGR